MNSPPEITGEPPDQKPLFGAKFDWKDQDRVLNNIQALAGNINEAWPAIVDHLKDDRYCITLNHEDYVQNDTIGDICFALVSGTLIEAFVHELPPDEEIHRHLSEPDFISFENLQDSCRKKMREGRSVFDMQVEAAEWAISKLKHKMDRISDAERNEAIKKIQLRLKQMNQSKKVVTMKSFVLRDSRTPYSKKDAERIQALLEKIKR